MHANGLLAPGMREPARCRYHKHPMQPLSFPGLPLPFDARTQNRALIGCVLASLALHAALLFLLPGMREGSKATAPVQILSAVLSPRSAPLAPLPALPEPVAPPRPEPRPETKQQARPDASRPLLTAPTPSPSAPAMAAPPGVPVPAPQAAVAPPPQPAVAPRPAEAQALAAPSAGAPREGSDSADAGTLAQYRIALIGAANRYRRYPAQAMEKGWRGKVEIRLSIGSNGLIQSAAIKTSSGYPILDDTALDMIRKAKPMTQIPQALRGREFVVDVPVIFDLNAG